MPNNSIDPTLAPASARRVARQDDRRLVILVANSKGGCGKTTLATNLAAYFAHSGQAVTLLDLDPQQSATQWVRLREDPRVEALGWPADEPVSLGRLQDQMQKARDVVVIDSPAGMDRHTLERFAYFEEKVASYPEVQQCYLVTGQEADYLLKVVVPDIDGYQHFLLNKITRIEGVSGVHSSFVMRRVVDTAALPLNYVEA